MGFITDILKDIPVNAVLREKLKDFEKKHEELEAEITKLKGENKKLVDENQQLKSELKELTNIGELGEDETKILRLLAMSERELTDEEIAGKLGFQLVKTKYYLERMWREYICSYDYVNGRPSEYYLIQKGREYLIKNNLI